MFFVTVELYTVCSGPKTLLKTLAKNLIKNLTRKIVLKIKSTSGTLSSDVIVNLLHAVKAFKKHCNPIKPYKKIPVNTHNIRHFENMMKTSIKHDNHCDLS